MGNDVSLKQFRKEINAVKAADECDEVVKYFGITFFEREPYMCMELMDLSLDKLYVLCHKVGGQSFHEPTLGSVAVATIRALEHMKNKHGIIHRDIKPSNILLNRKGLIKLCDFGICGLLQDSVAHTREVGCRPYMAPERISPSMKGYDVKSDVWSLGISMLEVANGMYPYPGFLEATIMKQVEMIVYGDPPLISETANLSLEMKRFIMLCVTKDPSVRASFNDLKSTDAYKKYSGTEYRESVGNFVLEMYELRKELGEVKA
ncbi:unnamed protein product [Caenorhabditis bovis]|uniref:mitogen-activated protein kinase kinase n=1 Tax=Caenorhabditis bovis TaxID=2654633 RepID=A0A8S1EAD2_9PELO|nr:unnamed protein product [Caenorhabditis bovis]